MFTELLEQHARHTPRRPAVVSDCEVLTCRELADQVGALTDRLARCGVQPGSVVAVEIDASTELLVALLAIVKLAALYVCVDRRYPDRRRRQVLVASAAQWLVYRDDGDCTAVAERVGLTSLAIAGPPHDAGRGLCGVYCTSGSTGTPKAVLATLDSITNRLRWMQRTVPFERSDVAYLRASPAVVMSGWEMFSPLLANIPVFVPPAAQASSPDTITARVDRHGITHLGVVPSVAQALLQQPAVELARLRRLRVLEIGGEPSPPGLIRRLAAQLPATTIIHRYGSTEHPAVICRVIRPGERVGDSVAAGRPIDGVHAVVLDDALAAVPAGEIGMLYTGGAGIAAGYADQPALTAERFIADPRRPGSTDRFYCTGDLARVNADGEIEIVGRRDFAIKIFGHRIEPREVELVLLEHPGVREAVVVKTEDPRYPEQLVAWVVRPGGAAAGEPALLDDPALHQHLAGALPSHMVPRFIVTIGRLPRLPSGKLDRIALRGRPLPSAAVTRAPEGCVERLRPIWCAALGLTDLRAGHDFFELGGDSLSAFRIVAGIRRWLGIEVPVRMVFDFPSVDDFCREVGAAQRQEAP